MRISNSGSSVREGRKGLILLVVLGMLTLFTLLAVTFVVFSSQSVQASRAFERPKQRMTPPNRLGEMVVKQVIRGTKDPSSPIYGHDLMQDLYGKSYQYSPPSLPILARVDLNLEQHHVADMKRSFSFADQTVTARRLGTTSLVQLTFNLAQWGMNPSIPLQTDFFTGRLLTIQQGPLTGQTYRIHRSIGTSTTQVDLLIDLYEPFHYATGFGNRDLIENCLTDNAALTTCFAGRKVLINEAAFTNPGLDPTQIVTFAPGLALPAPLLGRVARAQELLGSLLTGTTAEDYDAADYNNWFLSYRFEGASADHDVIPSFHRPAVIYHAHALSKQASSSVADSIRALQAISLRPLSLDIPGYRVNPYFPGPKLSSESDLDNYLIRLVQGPWDVDNDGDNVRDSIWLDLNLPTMTALNGKVVKPLAAISIVDQESKLNLNAHGDRLQYRIEFGAGAVADPGFIQTPSVGSGFGPADISIAHLFDSGSYDTAFKDVFDFRHGADQAPGKLSENDLRFFSSKYRTSRHRHFPASSGLPLNVHSNIAMGIDPLGNPRLRWMPLSASGISLTDEIGDSDPYKSTAGAVPTKGESYFSISELDSLLRQYDADRKVLPGRIAEILNDTTVNADVRRELSHIVTVAGIDLTNPVSVNGLGTFANIQGMLRDMIRVQNLAMTQTGENSSFSDLDFTQIFPPEFSLNAKMDLNIPIGNGFDDNGNGAIDEPAEIWDATNNQFADLESYPVPTASSVMGQYLSDTDPTSFVENGRVLDSGPNLTRSLAARYLYCLAQAIIPARYQFPGMPAIPPNVSLTPAQRAIRARAIAQWAVNVIDYRDSDSAMTRFAYDEYPFGRGGETNVWSPTPGCVVWGMEYPELVFSEVLATHDVGVQDTYHNTGGNSTTMRAPTNADNDTDQYVFPTGSLFVELYAPRTGSNVNDLYTSGTVANLNASFAGRTGVNVSATTPAVGARRSMPVWRIAISPPIADSNGPIPNEHRNMLTAMRNPTERWRWHYQATRTSTRTDTGLFPQFDGTQTGTSATQTPDLIMDRFIWLAPLNPSGYSPSDVPELNPSTFANPAQAANDRIFYNRSNTTFVEGGGYLVIGPRAETAFGSVNPGASVASEIFANTAAEQSQPLRTLVRNLPSPQRIVFGATGVDTLDLTGVTRNPIPGSIKQASWMVAACNVRNVPGVQWTTAFPSGMGLNISIPNTDQLLDPATFGYIPPTRVLNTNGTANFPSEPNSWIDVNQTNPGNLLPDTPFDVLNPILQIANTSFEQGGSQGQGTIEDARLLYLQRVADPSRPYDPIENPYITVDLTSTDLTVFSGEYLSSATTATAFGTTQRTGKSVAYNMDPSGNIDNPQNDNVLAPFTFNTDSLKARAIDTSDFDPADLVFFGHLLGDAGTISTPVTAHHPTIGFLNIHYGQPAGSGIATDYDGNAFVGRPSFLGPRFAQFAASDRRLGGLHWMNRDFATPFELLLVPTCSPGQFHQSYTNAYLPNASLYDNTVRPMNFPFGHLWNYYNVSDATIPGPGLDILKIFDFTCTPSRFSGVNRIVPFTGLPSSATAPIAGIFSPPYNYLRTFREPGKLNLNTTASPFVWKGIEGNFDIANRGQVLPNPLLTFSWDDFKSAREGFEIPAGTPPPGLPSTLNSHVDFRYPTEFVGVFRNAELHNRSVVPYRATSNQISNSTLFRPASGSVDPLVMPNTAFNDPFLTYQPLTRLPNLVSQRSNVFVVRITIGYFEYDDVNGLGQEYLGPQGEFARQKFMYVVDRSIPVGYITGEDLNVENTIVYRQVIQQ